MARHPGGERFRLELEALAGDDAPPVVRLRSALKCLLRAFRLKCRRVESVPPGPPPAPPPAPRTTTRRRSEGEQ
jgi:hypothetical protein